MISDIQIWIQPRMGLGRCGDMMSISMIIGYIEDFGFRGSFHVVIKTEGSCGRKEPAV